MNNLQTFNFNNQPVRTVQLNNQPYWVLKDVCDVLELSNPTVVANRLEDDERAKSNLGHDVSKIDTTPNRKDKHERIIKN